MFLTRENTNPTSRSVNNALKASLERAGINKKVTVHTLRHCFATHLLEDDANLFHIKKLLGHQSLSSTVWYLPFADNAALGGHVDHFDCGHTHISYNSCRNRHCPKCQGLEKERWVSARMEDLLPVPYYHVVFTLPEELNRLVFINNAKNYDLLMKASAETDNKFLVGSKKFFIPVKVLAKLFRGKFLFYLKQLRSYYLDIPEKDWQDIFYILYRKNWYVYGKRPFKSSGPVLKYLGRYTHRIAISNHRILTMDTGFVTFDYRDYEDKSKKKTMRLTANELIRRFLLHVLPIGFRNIRYYGFLAPATKKIKLKLCMKLLGVKQNNGKLLVMFLSNIS